MLSTQQAAATVPEVKLPRVSSQYIVKSLCMCTEHIESVVINNCGLINCSIY